MESISAQNKEKWDIAKSGLFHPRIGQLLHLTRYLCDIMHNFPRWVFVGYYKMYT